MSCTRILSLTSTSFSPTPHTHTNHQIHHFTFTERGWCETMVDIQAAAEGTAAAADATSMKGPVGSRAIDATPTADVGPGGKPLDEQDGDSPLRMVLSAGPTAAAKLYLSHRASSVPSSLGEDVDGDTGVAGVAAGAINRRSEHNNPKPATANSQFDADHGDMIEVGAVGASIMQEITRRVASDGGAALIVDYGKDQASTSSLRGIYDHKFVDVLDRPGDVDLSADVDFSALREATRAALAGMLTAVDEVRVLRCIGGCGPRPMLCLLFFIVTPWTFPSHCILTVNTTHSLPTCCGGYTARSHCILTVNPTLLATLHDHRVRSFRTPPWTLTRRRRC